MKIFDLKNKRCNLTLLEHKSEIKFMDQMKNGWQLTGFVEKTINFFYINRFISLTNFKLIRKTYKKFFESKY